MIIKIEGKQYNFKYLFDEVTLDDYLDVIDIINEDQYDTFIDQHTKKEIKRKEPRPKVDRDERFIFDTYRKVIQRLSNIPLKYLKEDEVVKHLLEYLVPIFTKANELETEIDLEDENFPSFTVNGEELFFTSIESWTFYKWVTLEMLVGKGLGEKVINDEGEEEIVQIVKGNRYILPLVYGIWDDKLDKLDEKFNYFNKEATFITTYKIFIRILHLINKVKKLHNFIYNTEGGNVSNSPHLDKHNKDFGWVSTLSDLAEKGVFGTYNEVKKANLLDVLEYLNCSCSKNSAESNDALIKNNK